MSSYLAGLKTYSFQVEEFFDDVQDDGQKIQLSNQRHLSVSRPDKVFGEDEGDTANSLFYYDGKTVTVYDRAQKTYATEKVPGTIDAMLDDLHDRFDTRPDPGRLPVFRPLQGVHGKRAERDVCRLAPRGQGEVPSPGVPAEGSWTGKSGSTPASKPLPRKLLITFKRQVDQPQYTALIHRWDVNPKLSDDLFQFQPPEGVRKVDFLNRHAEPNP